MQGKTRYVYVGLGIGGFQPAPANHVDTKGYGDCKGLSNYTKTIYNYAGTPNLLIISNLTPFLFS